MEGYDMEEHENFDMLDQTILHILSLYEDLRLLELWFEIGELGTFGSVKKQDILNRLYSLLAKGCVDRIDLGNGNIKWSLKRDGVREKIDP